MPDPNKLMALITKLGFAMLALVVTGSLVAQIANRLTGPGALLGLIALALMSPIAYLILRAARPSAERRPRRGAERTPLLPPNEEQ